MQKKDSRSESKRNLDSKTKNKQKKKTHLFGDELDQLVSNEIEMFKYLVSLQQIRSNLCFTVVLHKTRPLFTLFITSYSLWIRTLRRLKPEQIVVLP